MAKKYESLSEAEEVLNIDYLTNDFSCDKNQQTTTPEKASYIEDVLSPVFKSSPIFKEKKKQAVALSVTLLNLSYNVSKVLCLQG